MADKDLTPKGSWLLRILIVVLAVFMLASILYPRKLWDRQDALTQDCRERMENLNYVVQRYAAVNKLYTAEMDTLIHFIQTDSVLVKRALYEFEKLSLYDAENDCLLVGFVDQYHFDSLAVQPIEEDSLMLSLMPKERFTPILEPLKTVLHGEKKIDYFFRGKGEHDIYYIIYSDGKINRVDLPFENYFVPSKDYLLFRDLQDIQIDPISGKPFELTLNARITIDGLVTCTLLKKGSPEHPILENELLTNLLVNKMARSARAQVDAALKRDSTLYDRQLELQSDYFEVELEKLSPRRPVEIEGNREIVTPLSGVDQYRSPERIKTELFKVTYDSLIRMWTGWEKTQDLFSRIRVTEEYTLSKIDTIGVTISPPFGDTYPLEASSILDKVFSVGPIKNPGHVENNDLSWEEKR